MKVKRLCLLALLVCSCREVVDNPTSGPPEVTMERREEVRKIISGYLHHSGIDVVRGPLTVREIQKELNEHAAQIRAEGGGPVIPGGPEWKQLKAKLKPGDELYFYKTDLRSCGELRGREGYVAIRGNDVVGSLLTLMN